ncbi:TPA: attachment protein, partial [Pseudomonas aeruginosa]
MRFLFLLPLLWVQVLSAWAEDYYWTVPYPDGKVKYQSAVAACSANNQFYIDRDSGKYTRFDKKNVVIDSGHWSCGIVAYALNSKGVEYVAANFSNVANRKGDSCPAGTEYNETTGSCDKPCEVGDLFPAKGPDSPVVTSGGRNYVGDGGAPSACYQSCEYGGNPSPASCYLVKGSTTTGFCNYILKGTGQSCGADSYTFSQTGDSLNPPDTPNTDPSDPNDPGCPPGWSWSGTT